MDEIKILNFIIDNYIPKEQRISFRHAEQGGQLVIRPKKGNMISAMFYSCDGYTRINYDYDPNTKTFHEVETLKDEQGDYHHRQA